MDTPFIGSEALACGLLNRHRLRTRFQAICPGVYLARHVRPSLHDRIHAAWLWSHRQGIVCGLAAAALHGAKWIGEDVPVELVYANPRPPRGVKTRRDVLLDDEMHILDGLSETTPARTVFDIGRRGKVDPAVARLDALARATGLKVMMSRRLQNGILARQVCVNSRPFWISSTPERNRRRKHGCDCCAFAADFPSRRRRFLSSPTMVCRSHT